MRTEAGPGSDVRVVELARDRLASRQAPSAWSAAAIPLAALSAFLAWGAVAPTGPGDAARVGVIPASAAAVASALFALAAGWWLRQRSSVAPLWLLAASLLPWLSVAASGPLLLWHGPAALVVVAAVTLLVTWPLLARLAGMVRAREARDQAAVAFLVTVVAYGAAAWRMQPQLPGGDEPHYLVITQSLLSDGDLRIENNHRQGDYRAYTAQELKPDFLKRGLDGQIYSVHAPGTSVLVLPAFAVAGYPGAVAWLVLVSAAGAMLAWWAAWRLTGDAAAAWVGWSAVALSAPYFFETFAVFPDGPGAVLTMLCVATLVAPERLRGTGATLACGIAAAALPWLHTRYAIIAGVLGVLLAIRIAENRERRGARLAVFFAVPLVSVVTWLGLFKAIYGTVSPVAPYGGYTQSSIANAPRGLTGLLLDQQFGVLPNAPAYAVALLGGWALWRLRRRLALELAAIVVPYALAVACYHMWWGGRSAPARFLVPVLLPLALPVAAFWQGAGRAGRAFAGAAVITSVAIAFGLAWTDRGALVFNVRDGYALWLDALAPLVRLPLAFPSLFRGTPARAWVVALGWAAVVSVVVAAVRRYERRASLGRVAPAVPAFQALVAASVLLIATAGSAVGWRLADGEAVDAGNGLLRIARRAESGEVRGWRSADPAALAPPAAFASSIELPSVERRAPDPATPWTGVNLPAGRYEVRSTSGLRVSGRLTVLFGREGVPLAEAALRDAAPGLLPLAFALPGGAAALRVAGDAEAVRTAGAIHLRLAAPIPVAGPRTETYAHAVSHGVATTWFLDGNAFVEPGGFWVRGSAQTALVIDGKGRSPEMVLRPGPVAVTVTVTVGRGDPTVVTLQPGTFETLGVTAPSPTVVRVGASSGFRPREHDPSNPDARWLGVRVELR